MVKAVAGAVASYCMFKWADAKLALASDLKMARKLLPLKRELKKHMQNHDTTADIWEEKVTQYKNKPFFVFEGRELTYQQVNEAANQVAHWALSKGYKAGDVAALFMENRPEFFIIWLGLSKAGLTIALLNYNVIGKPLVHSIKISNAKFVVVGVEVRSSIEEIMPQLLELGLTVMSSGGAVPGWQSLDDNIRGQPTTNPDRKVRSSLSFDDKCLLVYTSGTTGLPKAATIKHARLFTMGRAFSSMFEVTPNDRIYCVLPLYHSAGGLCGIGMTFNAGATMILKRKFSKNAFWEDCRNERATVIQYIGELCRYLLQTPKSPLDAKNTVRIAIGNGLRPDIWSEFQDRFNLKQIGEFYGSTEGNAALMNFCDSKEARGAVGRSGWIAGKQLQNILVQFDVETEEPKRNKAGFCIRCKPGEVGELLGNIDPNDPLRRFDGYHGNEKATSSKVLENVFVKGDRWFRTGDLLSHDAKGFWHFVDRIGDTFRWKGENVSTTEVAEVVSTHPGVTECNVYGVAIPGMDGRAPCAAMVFGPDLDLTALAAHCKANLPSYAIPLFIRSLPEIEITGTFKHQKVALRNEGVNPLKIQDKLFILDSQAGTYKPLTAETYESLATGKSKL